MVHSGWNLSDKPDLTVDDWVDKLLFGSGKLNHDELEKLGKEFTQALTTLVEDMVFTIIGEDANYSEELDSDDVYKNELRAEQRQRAKAELKKRGFTV